MAGETARVQYIGAHAEVDVVMPDGSLQPVARLGLLETDAEHAAQLLEQAENWQTPAPASARRRRGAASSDAADADDADGANGAGAPAG